MIASHLASSFKVYVLGFMPGLAYIAGLDQSLYLPRRSQPRVRVPRSSVAIAMDMTTIYPVREPGRLAPDRPHAALDVRPAPRAAGVPGAGRFALLPAHRPQEPTTASPARSRPAPSTGRSWCRRMSAALKVVRPGLFDTLQDLGRIGFMALGMPTAGAMDRVGAPPGQRARAAIPPARRAWRSASWAPTCWSRPTACASRWSARCRRR